MKHKWDMFVPKDHAAALLGPKMRVCLNCGVKQTEELEWAWMRIVARKWRPLAGRCQGAAEKISDRCAHCRKTKGDHKADTLLCPAGSKTRVGYIHYGPTRFEKKVSKRREPT